MLAKLLILLIRIYQLTLSKMLGPVCRFQPSCSTYARDAIASFGLFRGTWLALRRLLRCHPFYRGPLDDPVPAPEDPAKPAADRSES